MTTDNEMRRDPGRDRPAAAADEAARRRDREAAALRANLQRRKQQARARRDAGDGGADGA